MVMAAAIAVFLAGLMVGRTPEYLGKKIGLAENEMIMLYALAAPLVILPLTAIAIIMNTTWYLHSHFVWLRLSISSIVKLLFVCLAAHVWEFPRWTPGSVKLLLPPRQSRGVSLRTRSGLSGLTVNTGPHGFTGILFAYSSCFANNGQSFAGLSANTPFYNLSTASAMMVGRFGLAIPALTVANLFGGQRSTPSSSGTLPTPSLVFGVLLTSCLIVTVALSYLPALALGPVMERLLLGR